MLTWSSDLSVYVVEIDAQHKELFGRINSFLDALEAQSSESPLGEIMSFLEQYLMMHFDYEEAYMDRYSVYGYAQEAQHKATHRAFKRDFAEFKADMIVRSVTPQFTNEFKKWIVNWWLIHINKIDKDLGKFIKTVILL